jgi:hypothetical protein
VPAPGVPPLARGGTGAAGPHGPHVASVKVSDASASADVEEGEERVQLRGEEQVPRRFLRGSSHPLAITSRDDGPGELPRHYGIVRLDAERDAVVGCGMKRVPRLVSGFTRPYSRGRERLPREEKRVVTMPDSDVVARSILNGWLFECALTFSSMRNSDNLQSPFLHH